MDGPGPWLCRVLHNRSPDRSTAEVSIRFDFQVDCGYLVFRIMELFRNSTGRQRHLRAAGGIALLLSGWIALLPVLPFVHIFLSSHEHRYCEEHQWVEDVFEPGGNGIQGQPALSEQTAGYFTGNEAFHPSSHVACPFWSLHNAAKSLASPARETRLIVRQQPGIKSCSQPEKSSFSVLFLAPKRSPSSAAA